jgi:hypothetical protein
MFSYVSIHIDQVIAMALWIVAHHLDRAGVEHGVEFPDLLLGHRTGDGGLDLWGDGLTGEVGIHDATGGGEAAGRGGGDGRGGGCGYRPGGRSEAAGRGSQSARGGIHDDWTTVF